MSLRLPPPEGLTSRHIGAHPVGRANFKLKLQGKKLWYRENEPLFDKQQHEKADLPVTFPE
jgi:hypothetical protein